jgi:hypothetical protein
VCERRKERGNTVAFAEGKKEHQLSCAEGGEERSCVRAMRIDWSLLQDKGETTRGGH